MTFDRFEEILRQLSAATNILLSPRQTSVVPLNVNGVLHIQLECQEHKSTPHGHICLRYSSRQIPRKAVKETLKMNAFFTDCDLRL